MMQMILTKMGLTSPWQILERIAELVVVDCTVAGILPLVMELQHLLLQIRSLLLQKLPQLPFLRLLPEIQLVSEILATRVT